MVTYKTLLLVQCGCKNEKLRNQYKYVFKKLNYFARSLPYERLTLYFFLRGGGSYLFFISEK